MPALWHRVNRLLFWRFARGSARRLISQWRVVWWLPWMGVACCTMDSHFFDVLKNLSGARATAASQTHQLGKESW